MARPEVSDERSGREKVSGNARWFKGGPILLRMTERQSSDRNRAPYPPSPALRPRGVKIAVRPSPNPPAPSDQVPLLYVPPISRSS